MNDRKMTIFLYGCALILLCNYVLANGGYPTLLGINAIFSTIAVPVISIWLAYKSIVSLARHQWKKVFIYICILGIIVAVLPKIVIPILKENSEKRAYEQIKEFVLTPTSNRFSVSFWGNEDPSLKRDFQTFLSSPDMSAVRLKMSFPLHGRYDYEISPNLSQAFELVFWEHGIGKGGKIMIAPSFPLRRSEK